MNNTTLQNFLIDDVRALIAAIRNNEERQRKQSPAADLTRLTTSPTIGEYISTR